MPHDNRKNEYRISLSDQEFQKVENRRKETGLGKAKFGRQALLNGEIIGNTTPKINKKILAELNRNGNNLNQIARAFNIEGAVAIKKSNVKKNLEDFEKIIAELYNNLE